MTKRIIISLVIVVITALAVITIYFFSKTDSDLLLHVPKDANAVIVVDVKNISARLLIDQIGSDKKIDTELIKKLAGGLEDIDWSESGISQLSNVIIFTTQQSLTDSVKFNFLFQLSDYQVFEKFIENNSQLLDIKYNKQDRTANSGKYEFGFHWNKKILIVGYKNAPEQKGKDYLKHFLSMRKDESIVADSVFMKKLATGYNVLIYAKSIDAGKKFKQFIDSNLDWISIGFQFEEGVLKTEAELKIKPKSPLNQLFDVKNQNLSQFNLPEKYALQTSVNINSKVFFNLMNDYSGIRINTEKFPLYYCWDGRLNLLAIENKTVRQEFVSYDFDEDFNKIEVRKILTDTILNIQAMAGFNSGSIKNTDKQKLLFTSKNDTLLFKGSDLIISKITGSNYRCYNRNFEALKIAENGTIEGIFLEMNHKNFTEILKQNNFLTDSSIFNLLKFDKLNLQIKHKKNIKLKSFVYFTNTKSNSLISILENLEYLFPNQEL